MIKLWDRTKKQTIDVADDIDLSDLQGNYEVIKSTGQYDKKGSAIYIGDIVEEYVNLVFHNDFEHMRVITQDNPVLNVPENWVVIGNMYEGIWGKPFFKIEYLPKY